MENKHKLYIDEGKDEPEARASGAVVGVGAAAEAGTGQEQAVGDGTGREKAAMSSQKAAEGRSEEKADNHGGLKKEAPGEAAVKAGTGVATVGALERRL